MLESVVPPATAGFLWWIPALPLAGSALCGVLHMIAVKRRAPAHGHAAHGGHGHAPHGDAHDEATAHAHGDADAHAHGGHGDAAHGESNALAPWIACLAMAGAFALAILAFVKLSALPATERALESSVWQWIDTGVFPIDVSMRMDPLSAVMTLVITGIGLLIHVYAAGYMKGDPGYAKFFAYLNLFVFAMLMLVLSSSLLGLFVGWEGVGLCSYLLIGFWYEKGWPAEAGQKAFVMNRIGDACFLLGSFLLVRVFGTLDLSEIANGVSAQLSGAQGTKVAGELFLAGLLLFAGACGKSAQLPLFTWLPDAMAGPTPVSALIHAATMVTAGIYLVVRLNPLFAASPTLLLIIGCIGAVTAFIAGSTAIVQRDIKKVLAYSTVSQLGYMFLALGTGAFAAAIFHLVTHAFFKALLFLGAGSVIHGMNQEQDMHKMGGLARKMPATFATFLAGAAALSGLPLLSGYFSKDEILAHTYARGGVYLILWIVGIVTAAMTAFYTWRMVALTFFGQARYDARTVHPHESPSVMTIPLGILAVLAVLGGALGLPPVFHVSHVLGEWLEPVTAAGTHMLETQGAHLHLTHATEIALLILGALIALVFAHLGYHRCKLGPATDEAYRAGRPKVSAFLFDAWGIDTAYRRLVVQPVKLLAFFIAVIVDQFAIDGVVNGAAALCMRLGGRARRMADGKIATYSVWMGAVTALIAFLFLWSAR